MAKKSSKEFLINVDSIPAYEFAQLLKENGVRNIKFPVYPAQLAGVDLEELGLSERSSNALKRSRLYTVSQVVEAINGTSELMDIKNLGKTSALEIMMALYLFQYVQLPQSKRTDYLVRVGQLTLAK